MAGSNRVLPLQAITFLHCLSHAHGKVVVLPAALCSLAQAVPGWALGRHLHRCVGRGESASCRPACTNTLKLDPCLSCPSSGVGLIKACAEAKGRLDLASEAVGHGFKYLASSALVEAVQFELGGPNATSTPPPAAHRARPTAAAAARVAAAAAAAVQLPSTPPAAVRQAAPAGDVAPPAAGVVGGRGAPAHVRVRSTCDDDDGDTAPAGRSSSVTDPELLYLLQVKV